MAATVGEDGNHKVELTSEADEIAGDTLTVYYTSGSKVVEGASSIGVESGSEMVFTTDFEAESDITPGVWEWEVVRESGGVERQVGIEGESDNRGTVRVTDSEQI